MQITYNNTTINFWNFELPKKILISLSGGLDSAAAAFLTCKHFPEIEIIPFNARDVNAPKDAVAAGNIVQWLQKEFSHVKIRDIEIYDFDDTNESFVSWAECDQAIKSVGRFSQLNRVKVSKILQLHKIKNTLLLKYKGALKVSGMTSNPPVEDMKLLGFYNLAERRRDSTSNSEQFVGDTYQPFEHVDKKFIADIYCQNNLINTLYPLTRSCVGKKAATDNFTRECHQCFWCHEKKWAFNLQW